MGVVRAPGRPGAAAGALISSCAAPPAQRRLKPDAAASHDDHRLGMALAVMGLVTHGETLIHNARCVSDSFPGFVETMQSLGANMTWAA